MIMKYRARLGKIEAIEIERETKTMVFLPEGRRESKRTSFQNWFNSWDEAKKFLIEEAETNVNAAAARLNSAKFELDKLRDMSEA